MDREHPMPMHDDDGIKIEGAPLKRYGLSCDGETLGSWDTATEAWEFFQEYRDKMEPFLKPRINKRRSWRYEFRDNRDYMIPEYFSRKVNEERGRTSRI
jgi:hypothetical protein